MSTTTIETLLAIGERHARDILLKRGEKSLTALYHLVAAPGRQDAIIPCLWRNELQKDIAIAVIKAKAREIGAVAMMTVSEAWMLQMKDASASDIADVNAGRWPGGVPPSESPERIEVVMIVAAERDAGPKSKMLQIVRDKPGGRIVALVDATSDLPDTALAGRMISGII